MAESTDIDTSDWDWKTWAVFIAMSIAAMVFVVSILEGQKNQAQACIARGGQWIQYAKDYYGCVEAK